MTKTAAIKAEIDHTLAAVEEANATLQVGEIKEITFRMTKAAAIKAEIDRTLAAVEEANATLQVSDHQIKNGMVSKCYSGLSKRPPSRPRLTAPWPPWRRPMQHCRWVTLKHNKKVSG
jgi:hypothetical protein